MHLNLCALIIQQRDNTRTIINLPLLNLLPLRRFIFAVNQKIIIFNHYLSLSIYRSLKVLAHLYYFLSLIVHGTIIYTNTAISYTNN